MVVILKNGFVKELKKLPSHTQALVHQVLKVLRDSKTLESANLDLTRMEGQKKSESYFRIRVGQWRIGIEYDHPDVIVITILSRGNVYKRFPPK